MIEILHFVFADFWHWLGTVILLATLLPWGRFSIITINRKNNDATQSQ